MSGNQHYWGGLVGLRGPGKLSCGQFSPSNGPAGPGSPSMSNPQQRHARCGAVSARKICRWHIFSEQRAGRPRAGIFAERSVPGPTGPLLGEEEPLALPPGPQNPLLGTPSPLPLVPSGIQGLPACFPGAANPGRQRRKPANKKSTP